MPSSVGVTDDASNSCSNAGGAGLAGQGFVCFNKAGDVMKKAWERFARERNDNLSSLFVPQVKDYESYAHMIVHSGLFNENVPNGKAVDLPVAAVTPYLQAYTGYLDFPLPVLQSEDSAKEVLDVLSKCALGTLSGETDCFNTETYILGGNIPFAGDGMNDLPIHCRNSAFLLGRPRDDNIHH